MSAAQLAEASQSGGGSADRRGLSWSDCWCGAEGGQKYKGQMEGLRRLREEREQRTERENNGETETEGLLTGAVARLARAPWTLVSLRATYIQAQGAV